MNPTKDRILLAGLLLLNLVPALAGFSRLISLATGTNITADNARFFAGPTPVVLHIIAVVTYGVLGAFQFPKSFRRQHLRWHRLAGRLFVPSGFLAALSGLWMTETYPHVKGDGPTLYFVRWVVGTAMLIALILAVIALKRRGYAEHGAWMIRAYALGMGAGTQVLTHLPWFLLVGEPHGLVRDTLMAAGWLINACVAEWTVRRTAGRKKASPVSSTMRGYSPV
jgi:uncharacterized membrane protein